MANVEKTEPISSETLQAPVSSDAVLSDVKAGLQHVVGTSGDMQSMAKDVVPSNSETKMEGLFDQAVSTPQVQAAVESSEKEQAHIGEVGQSQVSATTVEREAGSSVEKEKPTSLVDKMCVLVENLGEKVASRPVGQTLLRQGDHVLCILEECVAWSVTPAHPDQAVQRPLPWVTFLPMLATLRVAGFGAKLVAPVFGTKSVSTETVVAFIRSRRRHIDAIRHKGIRHMKNEAKDSAQNNTQEDISLVEKFLLWWPVTVVTKVANFVGLGSQAPELSKTSPVKRNYEQMVKEHMMLDEISPPASSDGTSEGGDDEVEEEEENVETMLADDIIKRINEINFEEEDSEDDPDYEPKESDLTSETSSEVTTDEENPSAGEDAETVMDVEEERELMEIEEKRKLKVPRLERKDSDTSSTITLEDSKTEDKPAEHAEKELFVSATSSGYQSPEHPSSRTVSPGTSPNSEILENTPQPTNEPAVGKKPLKFSSLFSRKKT